MLVTLQHKKIINERKENGDFLSIEDFLSRIDSRSLNKRGVEALAQGGVLIISDLQEKEYSRQL